MHRFVPPARGTSKSFKIQRKTIKDIDDSDWGDVVGSQSSSVSAEDVAGAVVVQQQRSVPNHLLMVALLEHLCSLYEPDQNRSREIFKVLCQHLAKLQVMSPLSYLDEFSAFRSQYKLQFAKMIQAAKIMVNQKISSMPHANPKDHLALVLRSDARPKVFPFLNSEDIAGAHSSRYKEEFIEVCRLGKGGFGSVYKVKNKLDGCEYAVKKIRLKPNQPDIWLKILREVRVLAMLQHNNIVGYNAAWLEHDTPPLVPSPDKIKEFGVVKSSVVPAVAYSKVQEYSSVSMYSEDSHIVFKESVNMNQNHLSVKTNRITKASSSNLKIQQYYEHHSDIHLGQSEYRVRMEDHSGDTDSESSDEEDSAVFKFTKTNETSTDSILSHAACARTSRKSISLDELCSGNFSDVLDKDGVDRHIALGSRARKTLEKIEILHGTADNDELKNINLNRRYHHVRSISHDPTTEARFKGAHFEGVGDYSDENYTLLANRVVLYIQMHLCNRTLSEWIDERNKQISRGQDVFSVVDKDANMHIMQQILHGVEYIHTQGLIHRDLKPKNIFIQDTNLEVKIGDFGLTREDLIGDPPQVPATPLVDSFESPDLEHSCSTTYTSGIGTSLYAAPEQLKGSSYDSKCDMYSLGVVLFELFHPFSTEMEKHKCLGNLRKNGGCAIPEEIRRNWPQQAETIEQLINSDPNDRPSAIDVLGSTLFLTKDQIIENLKTKVSEQEKQIEKLTKLLLEKDKLIQGLTCFNIDSNESEELS